MANEEFRIQRFEEIDSSLIDPNPKNFRQHPEFQRGVVSSLLRLLEIGYVGAVVVRPKGERFELIDGHLRNEISKGQPVPALVVDLNDEEAEKVLLPFDQSTSLADTDKTLLADLVSRFDSDDQNMRDFIDRISMESGLEPPSFEPASEEEQSVLDKDEEKTTSSKVL